MAVLLLTVGASSDDADRAHGIGYDDTLTSFTVGGVGGVDAGTGQGWRFTNVTIPKGSPIVSANLLLMKSTTQFLTVDNRFTCEAADSAATFSAGSMPGQRTLIATIVPESHNENRTDGTVYNHPNTAGDRTLFGGAIQNVTDRSGWVSGNALNVLNQSDQDGSQSEGFGRELFHTWDSATASSEPQLSITYTVLRNLGFITNNLRPAIFSPGRAR